MYRYGMNITDKLYEECKRLLGHEPTDINEIHGLVEDQYVKAKYGNEKAREFVNLVRAAKQQKIKKPKHHYLCLQCREIVDVKMKHMREKHKDMYWLDDDKPYGNLMKYMFMGVD